MAENKSRPASVCGGLLHWGDYVRHPHQEGRPVLVPLLLLRGLRDPEDRLDGPGVSGAPSQGKGQGCGMISRERVRNLRRADVLARIDAQLSQCEDFVFGRGPYGRLRLRMSWDGTSEEYSVWLEKTVSLCRSRIECLVARRFAAEHARAS